MKERTILLVEDDEDRAVLAVRALRKYGLVGEADGVVVARTGEEALDRRLGAGEQGAGRGTPALVLLDKDLPGTDGRGVLRRMRADRRTRLVPVVLFSSSGKPEEVAEGYRLGANYSCVTKPADHEGFSEDLGCLGRYPKNADNVTQRRNPSQPKVHLLPQPGHQRLVELERGLATALLGALGDNPALLGLDVGDGRVDLPEESDQNLARNSL